MRSPRVTKKVNRGERDTATKSYANSSENPCVIKFKASARIFEIIGVFYVMVPVATTMVSGREQEEQRNDK